MTEGRSVMVGRAERISMEDEHVFQGDGYVCYFDCGDGFRSVHLH